MILVDLILCKSKLSYFLNCGVTIFSCVFRSIIVVCLLQYLKKQNLYKTVDCSSNPWDTFLANNTQVRSE